MVRVDWKGKMRFEATPPSGVKFIMDDSSELDGEACGPSPLETLLGSIAACSAMDVISIMEKKRQDVTAYRVEVEGERSPPDSEYPRPYTAFTIKHFLSGRNLDPAAVERSVQLSDEKYCSVLATLRENPKVASEWHIE